MHISNPFLTSACKSHTKQKKVFLLLRSHVNITFIFIFFRFQVIFIPLCNHLKSTIYLFFVFIWWTRIPYGTYCHTGKLFGHCVLHVTHHICIDFVLFAHLSHFSNKINYIASTRHDNSDDDQRCCSLILLMRVIVVGFFDCSKVNNYIWIVMHIAHTQMYTWKRYRWYVCNTSLSDSVYDP